jgi:hypothetical protein
MEQIIELKYYNQRLQIGIADWKTVYLLINQPVQLFPEVNKGKLMYRAKGSAKRFSYSDIKKDLIIKKIIIRHKMDILSF